MTCLRRSLDRQASSTWIAAKVGTTNVGHLLLAYVCIYVYIYIYMLLYVFILYTYIHRQYRYVYIYIHNICIYVFT